MENIKWKQLDLKQTPTRGSEAFARVSQSCISLSATACGMIENIYDYSYVEIHCGMVNGTAVRIGLRFNKEKKPKSIRVSRRKHKGEYIGGLDIRSKAAIEEIYGKVKDDKSSRHPVENIDDNMISIDITKEI